MRCCTCGNTIPPSLVIDGKWRNLQNRKFCLICSPFGSHNTRDVSKPIIRKEKFRRYQEKERRTRKDTLVDLLGGRCAVCGYNRCTAALEFHHRDASQKQFPLNKANLLRPWDVVVAEAEKCDLLCANCHRELEERLRQERGDEFGSDDTEDTKNTEYAFDFDAGDDAVIRERSLFYLIA